MRELFGTDGIRGIANKDLNVHLSLRVARAAATVLRQKTRTRPSVLIGRDTRISCDMIEAAMTAGFCSAGVDVISVGVIPTAGVAYLAQQLDVDMGAMISASHNPYEFNGIKFFSHEGYKLPDSIEVAIEQLVQAQDHLDHPLGVDIGRRIPGDPVGQYLEHLHNLAPEGLRGMRLVVDCAHGAAYTMAPSVLRELGAEVIHLNCAPDGMNINDGCGAMYPEVVAQAVCELGADAGLSFDGDADRLLLADEQGQVINGDHMLAIAGYDLHQQGRLPGGIVVGTVMSNLGLERGLERLGMRLVRTQVGDRYVLEEMRKLHATLGGEQSGHVIFLDHATTGDGLVSALMLLRHLRASGEKLSALTNIIEDYPQKLLSVTVPSIKGWEEHTAILQAISAAESALGSEGRVLVRASGTEPKIRVMVEGANRELVEQWCVKLADLIREQMTA